MVLLCMVCDKEAIQDIHGDIDELSISTDVVDDMVTPFNHHLSPDRIVDAARSAIVECSSLYTSGATFTIPGLELLSQQAFEGWY